jgi:hypothetical protein
MKSKTKTDLLAKRKEVMQKLIAQGVHCQQARFMVLSAGANPEGLLEDQPAGEKTDAELIEITARARKEQIAEMEKATKTQAANIQAALARLHNNQATNSDFYLLASSGYGYIEDNELGPGRFVFAPGDGNPYADQVE